MKELLTAPWLVEMVRTATEMYRHGWDERNGGNISLLLDESDVAEYVDVNAVLRTIPTGFDAPTLDGKYFLVTGTGKYFKNVQYAPDVNLGLIRIRDSGRAAELLWGYSDGGKFTSELPAHLMSHAARLAVNDANRVVMHCHPANLLAMTYIHDLDETFGLIETAEKAAEIYMKIAHLPLKQTITDDQLRLLADRFEVEPREGYLSGVISGSSAIAR